MLPRPAFAHRRVHGAQLQAGGAGRAQVAVQRRLRNRHAEAFLQEPVKGPMGATGLFAFEFDGKRQRFGRNRPRFAAVRARLTGQRSESFLAVAVELAPQRRQRRLPRASIGEDHLLLGKPLQILVRFRRIKLVKQDWMQQTAPENRPLLVLRLHRSSPYFPNADDPTSPEARTCGQVGKNRGREQSGVLLLRSHQFTAALE